MAIYKQKVTKYYNSQVKPNLFLKVDLVLHQAMVSNLFEQEKLAPNWEGSYRIAEVIHLRAYKIEHLDGSTIPYIWNTENLKNTINES